MQLSVRDVAQLLGVADDTVYRWINEGGIPFHRINKQYRFGRAEIFEWAMARRMTLSPAALAKIHRSPPAISSLAAALEAGGVVYDIAGPDPASILTASLARIALPEDVDRELLAHILLARRDSIGTDAGDGIAIPSVRNPIILNVDRPLLTLLLPPRPMPFGPGRNPLRALFMLVCPTMHTHLHLLSQLTPAIRDPNVRRQVLERAPADAIVLAFRARDVTP